MDEKFRELISGLKSAVTALESAMGVNKYTDGKEFGNPVQDFNDKDADMGGQDDGTKKGAFIAMMRKKNGDMG